MIGRARWVAEAAREALSLLDRAGYEAGLLSHYIPIAERIIHQADQRILHDVMLDADEKICSVFEEHTKQLKRVKTGKPIEFGQKILIAQIGEKFIHHYKVFPKQQENKELI